MNISVLFGFILSFGVFILSVITSAPISALFANWHAFLIVFGSTIAVAFICFPIKTLFEMVKIFFRRVMGSDDGKADKVISEIVNIATQVKNNPNFIASASTTAKHPFLKEGLNLISQGGFDEANLEMILLKRAETFQKRYDQQALFFKTLSKFPPAFGLLGTTLGMIGLMQSLGSPDSFKLIGPAMATGLGATLLGIALSNFILIPIAENLIKINRENEVIREIIIDGLKMLMRKQHPILVEEYLRSYQLPQERKSAA
jgi:chemotaxis protein MotA